MEGEIQKATAALIRSLELSDAATAAGVYADAPAPGAPRTVRILRRIGVVLLLVAAAALAGEAAHARERSGLQLVARIDVGSGPSSVAVHDGAVWVSLGTEGIVRLEQASGDQAARLRPDGAVIALASGFGSVWALDVFGDRLLRIDPRSNSVVAATPVRQLPGGLAVGHGSIWVASLLESTVSRIDPGTGRELALVRFAEGDLRPGGIAIAGDGVWVVTEHGNAVSRIDPTGLSVTATVRVPGARSLAPGRPGLWVGRAGRLPLVRIHRGRVVRAAAVPGRVGDGYGPAVAMNGSLWVGYAGSIARLHPATGALEAELRLPRQHDLSTIAAAKDVWVGDLTTGAVLRLRTDRQP